LKPEQWGSPLVQEKYQEEKACDKRHPYRIIIIILVVQNNKCYSPYFSLAFDSSALLCSTAILRKIVKMATRKLAYPET